MKIGIIGCGNVGKALASNFLRAGHQITFGARDPKQAVNDIEGAQIANVKDASSNKDFVFLAIPWGAIDDFCSECKSIEMNLVDCTNPLLPKLSGLDHRDELSGAEQIASKLPKANILKSFNQTGAENMRLPPIEDKRKPVMFFTTDKSDIADLFNNLVEESGFDAQYVGELKHSKALEHLAFAWISLAMKAGMGRDIAFYFKK